MQVDHLSLLTDDLSPKSKGEMYGCYLLFCRLPPPSSLVSITVLLINIESIFAERRNGQSMKLC